MESEAAEVEALKKEILANVDNIEKKIKTLNDDDALSKSSFSWGSSCSTVVEGTPRNWEIMGSSLTRSWGFFHFSQ